MKMRFTKSSLAALKCGSKQMVATDLAGGGLQVRVTPAGKKLFQVRFRPVTNGKEVLRVVGEFPTMSLEEARAAARAIVERAKAAPASIETTWKAALAEFEEHHEFGKPRAKAEILRALRHDFGHLDKRTIGSITKRDIVTVIDTIRARPAPVQANRTLTYVHLLFNSLIARDVVTTNPATGIKKVRSVERVSDRHLIPAELKHIWSAARAIDGAEKRSGTMWGDVFGLLILTGCRASEVTGAVAAEVDLDKALWTIPGERMKGGYAHVVPLSPPALEIMRRRIETVGDGLLFSTTGNTAVTISTRVRTDIKAHLKANGGELAAWRVHDIRHGFRTGLSALGVLPHVAERCIAHLPTGIAATYEKHDFLEEKTDAFRRWGVVMDAGSSPGAAVDHRAISAELDRIFGFTSRVA